MQAGAGEALAQLAERLVAPVILTYSARGLLPPDHPCLVAASPHVPQVGALWDEADVVIALGSDLDGMMTQGWKQPQPPHLIAINVDPADAAKNYLPDVLLEADAAEAAARLAERITPRGGLEALGQRLRALDADVRAGLAESDPEALAFLDAMERALPEDAVVVCDMCIPGYWLGGFARPPKPRKLAYPLGWGTLGCAFPQGLGAALAGAGPVVSVSGDGGFLYACGELAALAQERIPLTALIVDDGGYGMLRFDQDLKGDPREGVDLHTPDFVALARSFGVRADAVEGLGERFEGMLGHHLRLEEPTVLVANARLGAATERLAALVPAMSPRRLERRLPPRDELLESAAEASRAGLRSRQENILGAARPILHTSIAAALAWFVATELLDHPEPFFAPISAVITLGLTVGERRRRAVEIAVGVAVGIAIADALVAAIGGGTWQIGVIVGLAMAAATLVGGGPLLASQAGASAVLVATLQPPDGGFDFDRFVDALVGGGVALLVSSLILPVNPQRMVHESVEPVIERLVTALERIASALQTREPEAADAALLAVARLDAAHDGLVDALDAAGDAARLSPAAAGRWAASTATPWPAASSASRWRTCARSPAEPRGRSTSTTRCRTRPWRPWASWPPARGALGAYLAGGDPEPARVAGTRAAALANAVLEETGNLSAVHIVGQIRLAAVDMLRATGLERGEAQELVRGA